MGVNWSAELRGTIVQVLGHATRLADKTNVVRDKHNASLELLNGFGQRIDSLDICDKTTRGDVSLGIAAASTHRCAPRAFVGSSSSKTCGVRMAMSAKMARLLIPSERYAAEGTDGEREYDGAAEVQKHHIYAPIFVVWYSPVMPKRPSFDLISSSGVFGNYLQKNSSGSIVMSRQSTACWV